MLLILFLQEMATGAIRSPAEVGVEETISSLVLWLKLFVELLGAAIVAVGIVLTVFRLVSVFKSRGIQDYERARLTLARFLALALEFALAADILATTVAPTWTQIGQLGAIAVIRTGLNFFLAREVKEEQEEIATLESATRRTAT